MHTQPADEAANHAGQKNRNESRIPSRLGGHLLGAVFGWNHIALQILLEAVSDISTNWFLRNPIGRNQTYLNRSLPQ